MSQQKETTRSRSKRIHVLVCQADLWNELAREIKVKKGNAEADEKQNIERELS